MNKEDKALASYKGLKDSLVYTMSLSSRELFHSNVWVWLMENDPTFINVFFPDFNTNGLEIIKDKSNSIRREWKHIDISIILENEAKTKKVCYMLENKILSLKGTKQLTGYLKKLAADNEIKEVHIVYTGLVNLLTDYDIAIIKKRFEENFVVSCTYLSYKVINEKIKKYYLNSNSNVIKDNQKVLEDYCKSIDDFYALLEYFNIYSDEQNKGNRYFKYNAEDQGNIDLGYVNIRLDDYFKKLKGCDFLEYVKTKLERDDKLLSFDANDGKYVMYFFQDVNNNRVTLDIRWTHNDNRHAENGWDGDRVIGIQIEDYDYRFVYGISPASNKETEYDDAFNEICNVNCEDKWLDNDYKNHKGKLFNKDYYPTSLNVSKEGKLYNKYGGINHKQTFIYQYYNLPGKPNSKKETNKYLTYSELYERIKIDLFRAEAIIKKMAKTAEPTLTESED